LPMHHILKILGYNLTYPYQEGTDIYIQIMRNTDGSIRRIWPVGLKKPIFLKFTCNNTLHNRFFNKIIQLIFAWRVQRFFFRVVHLRVERHQNVIPNFDLQKPDWAIAVQDQLVTLICESDHVFYKIATSSPPPSLETEYKVLSFLAQLPFKTLFIPKITFRSSTITGMEDILPHITPHTKFSDPHLNALQEIYKKTSSNAILKNTKNWQETQHLLSALEQSNQEQIPKGMLQKLRNLSKSLNHYQVSNCLSNGNFTAENVFIKEKKLVIHNWESASYNIPLGFDAFHFIIHQSMAHEHLHWKKIREKIENLIPDHFFPQTESKTFYLKLYLLFYIVRCLHLYIKQNTWNTTILKQLEVWNTALSDVMKTEYSPRKLLLLDVFDFLQSKEYAIIKPAGSTPNEISDFTDIGLYMSRKDTVRFQQFLKHHALVKNMICVQKSALNIMLVLLDQNKYIHFEVIHKLK
jgi:hypothetical protein